MSAPIVHDDWSRTREPAISDDLITGHQAHQVVLNDLVAGDFLIVAIAAYRDDMALQQRSPWALD